MSLGYVVSTPLVFDPMRAHADQRAACGHPCSPKLSAATEPQHLYSSAVSKVAARQGPEALLTALTEAAASSIGTSTEVWAPFRL